MAQNRKKILILTAAFGEGHNTAAQNISEALQEYPEITTRVADIYAVTHPLVNKIMQKGYVFAINRHPFLWEIVFNFINRPGSLEKTLFMARQLKQSLGKLIGEFAPDVIVSTYPFYSFLIHQLRQECHLACKVPFVTVITDSTAINTSWYRSPGTNFFIVADEETAEMVKHDHITPEKIKILGFPVAPRLANLAKKSIPSLPPWKILYLPSSQLAPTLEVLRELLQIPGVQATVVTGKLKDLYESLKQHPIIDGEKVKLLGWTNQIPELLTSHHLYIGKAGGAIVHEAMAAQCPILVNHVVPGQEEGNIELIERLDIGRLVAHYPANLAASVREVFARDATTWHRWKKNLTQCASPAASQNIASFIMSL
jgi:processive 1,2-diacylglycerol beta-glucosyltransferase